MASRRRNDSLGSEYWSSGEMAEEDSPTHEPANTTKSFIQLASCLIAVSLDPLFLYIPVINDHEKCIEFDKKLRIAALVLRSVTDIIFMLHIAFRFRAGSIPHDIYGVNQRGARSWERAKTYMLSYFLIDILSLLPLPQVVVLSIIPEMKGSKSLIARNILIALVLLQYVPRVVRIYPLYKKLMRRQTIFDGTWTKAAFNLLLYLLASHVLGALWYFLSIERERTCWQEACEGHRICDHSSFFCDGGIRPTEFLDDMCPIHTPNTNLFDFGIFLDALQSGVVESVNLPQKLFRCFWWGLQNLSSLGQNLKTSIYVWENIFAVFISTSGLVLFLYFIGKIQTYMQQKTIKNEERRMEKRSKVLAVDWWMYNRHPPKGIESEIKNFVEKKWHEIKTVDLENLIPILPMDLQQCIKRSLCLDLVKRVPEFQLMDGQLLEGIFDRLKPMFYSKETYIIQKGDPVEEMHLIYRGKVTSRDFGFNNSEKQAYFCRELLTWASEGFSSNLPISNRTLQARTEVEAFVLKADALKLLDQFSLLNHVNSLAARVIQRAWHRYAKKKDEEKLREYN